jgi:hypothetical protein
MGAVVKVSILSVCLFVLCPSAYNTHGFARCVFSIGTNAPDDTGRFAPIADLHFQVLPPYKLAIAYPTAPPTALTGSTLTSTNVDITLTNPTTNTFGQFTMSISCDFVGADSSSGVLATVTPGSGSVATTTTLATITQGTGTTKFTIAVPKQTATQGVASQCSVTIGGAGQAAIESIPFFYFYMGTQLPALTIVNVRHETQREGIDDCLSCIAYSRLFVRFARSRSFLHSDRHNSTLCRFVAAQLCCCWNMILPTAYC